MSVRRHEGLSIVGLGAAACVACCAAPLLAFLGTLTIAGTVGTLLIGTMGLLVAIAGATASTLVRRRSRRCGPDSLGRVAVAPPGRRPTGTRSQQSVGQVLRSRSTNSPVQRPTPAADGPPCGYLPVKRSPTQRLAPGQYVLA